MPAEKTNTTVDWDEPIEAVRFNDGKVVPQVFVGDNRRSTSRGTGVIMETRPCPDPSETNCQWRPNGDDYCSNKTWFIRNVDPEKRTVTVTQRTVDKLRQELERLYDTTKSIRICELLAELPPSSEEKVAQKKVIDAIRAARAQSTNTEQFLRQLEIQGFTITPVKQ